MSEQDKAKKLTGDNVDKKPELQNALKSGINTYTGITPKTFNGREFSEALDKIEDTHYVFFFGQQGSGKSAIIGSLLRSLNEGNSKGSFILNNAGNMKHEGCKKLLSDGYSFAYKAHETLKQKSFMTRNDKGDLTVINGRFEPTIKGYNNLNITFLDMAGEDLAIIDANHGQGQLPDHINIFLKLSTLPLLIILVVPHDPTVEGKSEGYTDRLMAQFLEAVDNRSTQDKLRKPRVILLVTQWDSYTGKYQNNVTAFAKEKLRTTYALLNPERDLVSEYSIGRVVENEKDAWIESFHEEYPVRLWNRIYETFTGKSLNKKPWWQFF